MASTLPKEVRAQVEQLAWELKTQKMWTVRRIAEHINSTLLKENPISYVSVHNALKRVEGRVLKESEGIVERLKIQQTETLMHVASELIDSFEKSKLTGRRVTATKRANEPGGDGDLKTTETIVTEINEQYGDMQIVTRLQSVLEDVRKIWGVDDLESAKSGMARAISEKLNKPVVELSDEELIEIASKGLESPD